MRGEYPTLSTNSVIIMLHISPRSMVDVCF
jgi:hypothetical protein